jgi:hypothetical protein
MNVNSPAECVARRARRREGKALKIIINLCLDENFLKATSAATDGAFVPLHLFIIPRSLLPASLHPGFTHVRRLSRIFFQ